MSLPGWLTDPKIRLASLAARGLWRELALLMFESPRRGYLLLDNGKAPSAAQLANLAGCSHDQLSQLQKELEDCGAIRIGNDGVAFNPGMVNAVRGAAETSARSRKFRAGRRGSSVATAMQRNCNALPLLPPVPPSPAPPPPLSPINPSKPPAGISFETFWLDWPPHKRKANRTACESHWRSAGLDRHFDTVMASLRAWKVSADWANDGGQFIPAPLTWLRQGRWEATHPTPASESTHGSAGSGRSTGIAQARTRRSEKAATEFPEPELLTSVRIIGHSSEPSIGAPEALVESQRQPGTCARPSMDERTEPRA